MKNAINGALFLLGLFCSEAVAAPSFLHIEAIEGEVRRDGYEGWMDVWSLNFAVERAADNRSAPRFSELSVVKGIDKASPLLFREGTIGNGIPVVVIDFFRNDSSEPRYLRVRLSNVLVSNYSIQQSGADAVEVVALDFGRMELEQTKPDNSGTVRVYYNLETQEGGALPDGPPPGENSAPTITAIPAQNLAVNSSVVVDFRIDDAETPAEFLTLSRTSSNESLVPVSNITFSGSGNDRTATITPTANSFGSSVITIGVSDGTLSAASQFTLTVEQGEGPFISTIEDAVVGEGDRTLASFTIAHPSADLDTLLLTAAADDDQLLPPENIRFSGTGANRIAELTPATGRIGSTQVTITVSDGSLTDESSFLLTVEAVTPPPVITSPDGVRGVAGHNLFITGISISDPAAGAAPISLTINAPEAVLTVADDVPGGLNSSHIAGNGTSDITISGPLAAINTTLSASSGVSYLRLSDGIGDISIEASRSGSSSANIEVYLFDSRISLWRSDYFSDNDLNDPEKEATLWGDLANPTGDGNVNLLKYALGLSPLENHSSSDLPGVYLMKEGELLYLAFTIVRRTDDPSLEYSPQLSLNLSDWDAGAAVFEEHSITPTGDGLEQVTYRHLWSDDAPASRFVRVQVIRLQN